MAMVRKTLFRSGKTRYRTVGPEENLRRFKNTDFFPNLINKLDLYVTNYSPEISRLLTVFPFSLCRILFVSGSTLKFRITINFTLIVGAYQLLLNTLFLMGGL